MGGDARVAVKASVRMEIAPVALVACSRKTDKSATSGVKVGWRTFASESAAFEPAGWRIKLHRLKSC